MVGQDGDNTRDTSGEEDFTKEADFDNAQREIDIIQLKEIIESEGMMSACFLNCLPNSTFIHLIMAFLIIK